MAEVKPVTSWPWQPQSTITGNLAVGNLRENLIRRLSTEKGVQVETLFTAVGALAGFAAQNAALIQASDACRAGDLPVNALLVVKTHSGEHYLFGDWINIHLFNDPGSKFPLFGLVGAAMIQAGVGEKDLPNYIEVTKHIVGTLGTPEFGKIRAPAGHRPLMQPLDLLRKLWPFACGLFRLPLPQSVPAGAEPPLQEIHWPIVVSIVASQLVKLTKDALDPRISSALALEAAIITSKIDPEIIEPRKWKLGAEDGKVTVAHLIH